MGQRSDQVTRLLKLPPMPVYDPAKDGNPFAWIAKTAPIVKAERQAAMLAHRLGVRYVALRERGET